MKKIRMKVTAAFSRNLGGQIIVGDPEHPDEEGRILNVTPEVAAVLELDKQAKPYSLKDEARDELENEDGYDEDEDGVGDVDAASTAGTTATESAQQARERRTDTSGTRKGARRRAAPKKGAAPKATERGGAPIGGHDTNASTNHPTTAVSATGMHDANNEGASAEPGADAAPTE